jgi:hypothetical protein
MELTNRIEVTKRSRPDVILELQILTIFSSPLLSKVRDRLIKQPMAANKALSNLFEIFYFH